MPFIGQQPPAVALTSSDITDGIISTAKIADDAVTGAKTSYQDIPFRNLLINGDMQVAQRGTSFTSNGYTLDRYTMDESSDGAVTVTQDTDVPSGYGFAKSLKVDCTTADASIGAAQYCGFTQLIEGQNLQHLKYGTSSAETLTLSFWVKSVKTGTYCVRFVKEAGSGTRYETPIEYTISSGSTWEKKEITLTPTAGSTSLITGANGAIANSNASGFRVFFTLVSGSNFHATNNTWVAASDKLATSNQVNFLDSTSNNFWITGVQLEVGSTASDFEFVPYDVNLHRCLRYFQKTYDYATAPATSTDQQKLEISTTSEGGNNAVLSLALKVPLRTTPTLTFYKTDGTAGTWTYGRSGASGDASMTAYAGRYGQNHVICYGGVGAGWIACNVAGHYTVSAEL